MKIKAVCEATGLTDRAIRYYIQEELISPLCTENYLGRKNFDFSISDVRQLNDIAVLRKFGFSIDEIKEMILHPERINQICKKLQIRKLASVSEDQTCMSALSRLDDSCEYTISVLAAFLSNPVYKAPLPEEDANRNVFSRVLSFIGKIVVFLITWIPAILAVRAIFYYFHNYKYPVINGSSVICVTILLLPTLLILLASRFIFRPKAKRIAIALLLILCVAITPLSYFFTICAFSISETTNHHNYRQFDSSSLVDRDSLAQDLFPAWPEYSDIKYYYHYETTLFGNTCDIYAEWSLEEDDFASELARAQALYENNTAQEKRLFRGFLKIGDYSCYVWYAGTPPFETATEDYAYYIFGYNECDRKVRYIHCYSQINGADQPYYLSLDW